MTNRNSVIRLRTFSVIAIVSLMLVVGAGTAPVQAGPCLDRLTQAVDECNALSGIFERRLCYFEAGLEYEACLARLFR